MSDRDREVLQLLADGRRVAEIAGGMELSAHTVRNHIRRAMKHLGVHSRFDAVVALPGQESCGSRTRRPRNRSCGETEPGSLDDLTPARPDS